MTAISVGTTATHRSRYIPLPRRLEEEPLDERVPLLLVGNRQPLLRVVLFDKIEKNSIRLPDDEVSVLMIDEGGDATVRVELGVFGGLVLVLAEVEVDRLIGEPEFLEYSHDLPAGGRGGMSKEVRVVRKTLLTSHLRPWHGCRR